MIALVDCNNFFVSCERLFNPQLQGKPVVVLSSNDGCVIARSNEAKALGIPMGIPAFKCGDIFKKYNVSTLSSNFTLYADISSRVMHTLHTLCGEVEEYSIDEAFLKIPSPMSADQLMKYGKELHSQIWQHTGIPISIGIARTKTLAKAANENAKKNPQYLSVCCFSDIAVEQEFLQKLPVRDVWGIGKAYEALLVKNRITNAYQLTLYPDEWIRRHMSIVGLKMVWELRGKPCLNIQDYAEPAKSIIRSRSFGIVVTKKSDINEAISCHAARAGEKLRKAQQIAEHMTVFVAKRLFVGVSWRREYRSCSIRPTSDTSLLIETAKKLMDLLFEQGYEYKKCGIMLTELISEQEQQYSLLNEHSDQTKSNPVLPIMDKLNQRFGQNTVYFAAMGSLRAWQAKNKFKSQNFTSDWDEIPKAKLE